MTLTVNRTRHPGRRPWARLLFTGLALWIACLVVTLLTGNANLVPTLILLGSFVVPVAVMMWAYQRWHDRHLTAELLVSAFIGGGVLGILAASLLESYLLHPSPGLFLGVGLIEEAAKLCALVVITRHLPYRHARDGFVIGAAVGLGFAAFETAGYAFNAVLTVQGLSLSALVQTELVRGILTPFGHGLWTAILGGVLFYYARDGRFRYRAPVVLTYLLVSVIHALWDYSHSIALALTFLFTGTPWQQELLSRGYLPQPTEEQTQVFTLLSLLSLAVVALLGLITLRVAWRRTSAGIPQHSSARKESA
jgi:RsiW-degrading membrane proteinase PrsW (M82 family)